MPVPDIHQERISRKSSPLTGLNLEWEQAHMVPYESPADVWLGKEGGDGGEQIEMQIDSNHASTLIRTSYQYIPLNTFDPLNMITSFTRIITVTTALLSCKLSQRGRF